MTTQDLLGTVALVTGGGRGLGEAVCRTLARAGASVLVADLRKREADVVAQDINEHEGEAVSVPLDVGDAQQAEDAIRTATDRFGRLDVLVNNAGIDVTQPVDELEVADWDRVLQTNLRGPFLLSRLALRVMKEQGSGSIVNVVSTAAKRAWANASVYHASKWGLMGFTQGLHVEGREHGVKVTALVAGGMRTPFLLERFPDIDPSTLQDPANVAEAVRFVLTLPPETVIPELMVIPMRETSWP
ncbi:MAG TPA: SDR family oxidoreductase [Actinomycetota bacterium]|jgi:NAD(P)-dependent dehydrogenase (short-subunit alcohol dehydrogenase family)|nr:SDR family oxidoreductase [Actinomycetota bacterium]